MKKCLTVMLIIGMAFFSTITVPKANANPVVVAAGGVEIGALAFWGGAALVAAAGTAVGMDKELMGQVEDWGRSVWEGANEFIKAEITADIGAMKDAFNMKATYPVEWSPEVRAYLQQEWLKSFRYAVVVDGMIKSAPGIGTTDLPSTLAVPANSPYNTNLGIGKAQNGTIGGKPFYVDLRIGKIVCEATGACTVVAGISQGYPIAGTYPNAIAAYEAAVTQYQVIPDDKTVVGNYVRYGVSAPPIAYPAPDVFPNRVTLPAPSGTLNPDGTVRDYAPPTIGRVGGVLDGDIAVGFPDVVGDVGALNPADSITANPSIPAENTGTLEKDVSAIRTDVGTITGTISRFFDFNIPVRWDRLKNIPALVTNKFPFSLPWDVKNAVTSLLHDPELPKMSSTLGGQKFDIDISPLLQPLAPYIRGAVVLLFTLGLVLLTPRLLGGAK